MDRTPSINYLGLNIKSCWGGGELALNHTQSQIPFLRLRDWEAPGKGLGGQSGPAKGFGLCTF